jgi:hypothetical protein
MGSAYSIVGVLETGSATYLTIRYYTADFFPVKMFARLLNTDSGSGFPVLIIGLIIIFGINLIGVLIQTAILCYDIKFIGWLRSRCHKIFFGVVTLLSGLINYKIKLILFCKMFNFGCTRAQLESVQRFRIFNILSFLGVGH